MPERTLILKLNIMKNVDISCYRAINKVVDDNKKIPTGREIFESLLSQIVPVDFNVLAHPKFNELQPKNRGRGALL